MRALSCNNLVGPVSSLPAFVCAKVSDNVASMLDTTLPNLPSLELGQYFYAWLTLCDGSQHEVKVTAVRDGEVTYTPAVPGVTSGARFEYAWTMQAMQDLIANLALTDVTAPLSKTGCGVVSLDVCAVRGHECE